MIRIHKLTAIALSLLLVGGLSLAPVAADAEIVYKHGKPAKHRTHKKVIVIKSPARRHIPPGHIGRYAIVVPRTRYVWGVRVIRPHGRPYLGYGFFYTDHEAFKWLAFTAITLKILDNLNEQQQRMHEAAQVRATTAEVGEVIVWEDAGASGSVETTRIGTSTSGRQCREFQHTVTIGGRTEQAYGIACRQPDGSWEVVQ